MPLPANFRTSARRCRTLAAAWILAGCCGFHPALGADPPAQPVPEPPAPALPGFPAVLAAVLADPGFGQAWQALVLAVQQAKAAGMTLEGLDQQATPARQAAAATLLVAIPEVYLAAHAALLTQRAQWATLHHPEAACAAHFLQMNQLLAVSMKNAILMLLAQLEPHLAN